MNTKYSDSLLIGQYLEGKLNPKMMHELEKRALKDPFLWDALEGYEHTSNPGSELSLLQRQLHLRIVHLQENKKVFDLTWQRLSVAASASVLFIAAGILFWMNLNRSVPPMEKQVEVALMHRDSIKSELRAYEGGLSESKELKAISFDQSIPSANNTPNILSRSISTAAEPGVQPVPGWDIYRQYLKDNMRRPANEPMLSGSVLLSFHVDESGKATKFHVLQGMSKAYNLEAIRLVREGPEWKTRASRKVITGRIEIIF